MAKIFTIIVTYNGSQWIEKCLRNLVKSSMPTNIIIIDNSSTDNTIELIEPFLPVVYLIKNTENKGFGEANNQGIQHSINAGADYVFLLNQDAYVFENTIMLLVEAMKNNPDFGIISPLQLNQSGDKIDAKLKKYILRNYSEKFIDDILNKTDSLIKNRPYKMRFINAAAWMISKDCLQKTGLFHPAFYHYGEDNHYSSRVQFHGMKIGLLPASRIIHDRNTEASINSNLLLRQLKTIPLYTLLDIRKPLPVAYLLGRLKLHQIANKLSDNRTPGINKTINEQKKWFSKNLSEALKIRKKTKKLFI